MPSSTSPMKRSRSNNLYLPGNIDGLSPAATREVQNLYDRVNYLTQEMDRMKSNIPSMMTSLASKQNPSEGIITIPSLRGDGFIRVSQDGVIVSYSSPPTTGDGTFSGFIVGIPKVIRLDTSTVSSAGAGPDVLHTYDLPLGTLANDGDFLDVWYSGATATNNNDKAVQAQFGGVTYESMGAFDIDGQVGWVINVKIVRLSSTSVVASHMMNFNVIAADSAAAVTTFGASGFMISRNSVITGLANLNTTATTMRVRSLGVAAGDVFQNLSIIRVTKMT